MSEGCMEEGRQVRGESPHSTTASGVNSVFGVQVAELYRVIEEQNKILCSLKELANHNQLQQLQVCPLHKAQLHITTCQTTCL